jgi:signal transduction histidine kinase
MIPALEQVFSLLTTDLGSLVYHLVLAFSIAGAFQMSLAQEQRETSAETRRALLGLGLLLGLQLLLFASSGLVWQGVVSAGAWLPSIDRGVTLISLVVIIWLWAVPEHTPGADAAAFLLVTLAGASAILVGLWWSQQPAGSFNGTGADIAYQVGSLVLLILGLLVLIVRKPSAWGSGLWMLGLLALGHILHLFLPSSDQDYSGVVRLAQIAAFPFLLALPGRSLPKSEPAEKAPRQIHAHSQVREKFALYANPQLWTGLINLASETDASRQCSAITSLLARIMGADLCLWLIPDGDDGPLTIQCAYDAHQERHLGPYSLEKRAVPMLSASLRIGRSRRISGASSSPDLTSLGSLFGLERVGNLLFVPVLSSNGKPEASIILLAPFSERDWTGEEQAFLGTVARLLVQLLQHSEEKTGLKEELVQVRQNMRLAHDRVQQIQEENQKLSDQIIVFQDRSHRDQEQISSLAAMIAGHEAAQETIQALKAENERLKEEAANLAPQEVVIVEGPDAEKQSLEGELHLALEEIAFLNSALNEAEKQIDSMQTIQVSSPPSRQQIETIIAIAQDLRQPLSSIVGYTDFLLSEAIGILGANQRKYLERIKISTERMGRLINDLIQATAAESNTSDLEIQEIDLNQVIDHAIRGIERILNEKRISLNLDLPENALTMNIDQRAMNKIIGQLLQNASKVTPPGGVVALSARLENSEGQQDYILVQVSDSGDGISPDDLPLVFAPQNNGTEVHGIARNGVDLPAMKTLVELFGGRAWVDSDPGHGATFSLLLPVIPPQFYLEPGGNA